MKTTCKKTTFKKPTLHKKRDLQERMDHLHDRMAKHHWPKDRGIAEFLELEANSFSNTIEETLYEECWSEMEDNVVDFCLAEAHVDTAYFAEDL